MSPGPKTTETSASPLTSSALVLIGPGGKVAIGDAIDQAKKAFPPPKDAQVYDRSMSFAILGKSGWAWSSVDNMNGFEAAYADGKIVALATTGVKSGEPAASIKAIGQPTKKASGKICSMDVWDAGDDARIIVRMTASNPVLPASTITLIGAKSDLNMLNYRADDPGVFVKQMDSADAVANSPDIEIQETKERALRKK
ncbi:MAG TPA: hypothetical protein VMI31_01290 [Fimbriimonadaceae bacterium]|nr:hypothetical protein [Fimbriimonadaceae bacterium]